MLLIKFVGLVALLGVHCAPVEPGSNQFSLQVQADSDGYGIGRDLMVENFVEQAKHHGKKKEVTGKKPFRGAKSVKQGLSSTTVPSRKVGATPWNQFTLSEFPDYKIRVREDVTLCDSSVKQLAGYLDVEDRHFFFWFFESRSKPVTDPLILWLNGGPGCSSLTGLFMELGPCSPSKGGNDTIYNPHSWNSNANIIFLDQPTDVGFSYAADPNGGSSTTTEAAGDVYAFLQLFLSAYPKYAKLPFHVTGESYAGHYIPAIASAIIDGNRDAEGPGGDGLLLVNLTSIAIGNGLTDPLTQYGEYPRYACENPYGPVLDQSECDAMQGRVGTCQSLIQACYQFKSAFSCVPSVIYCNNAEISPFQKTGLNIYDIRKKCDPSNPLCYSILGDIDAFLNKPAVQLALGVDRPYQSCNMAVNQKFLLAGDWMRPYVNLIPDILDADVKVLIYAGDADYICNTYGNEAWVLALDWAGKDQFNEAPKRDWVGKKTGRPAGTFRMYENLAFLNIFEAGHMVPYDQPEHSLEFINRWITNDKRKGFESLAR